MSHQCCACNKIINYTITLKNDPSQFYCYKHYKQMMRYGHIIDTNQRTQRDPNNISIHGDTAYIDLYNRHGDVIAQAIIDAEDVEKVRGHKWKIGSNGYVLTTSRSKPNLHLSHLLLNTDNLVDHIDHNRLNNRKYNLREATLSQNAMNNNRKGVRCREDGRWQAYIKAQGSNVDLGVWNSEDEALLARWYGEDLLFRDFRFPKPKPIIPESDTKIFQYVQNKCDAMIYNRTAEYLEGEGIFAHNEF